VIPFIEISNKHKKMNTLVETTKHDLPVLISPALEHFSGLNHFFTTRLGGVSEGIYESLNLSFSLEDQKENVTENYKRVAKALECSCDDIVLTAQTHTNSFRIVTKEDAGKGVVRPSDFHDIDGLLTKEKGIALSVFTADCIPILYFDPVKEVIGTSHCGWRGTASLMQSKIVQTMGKEFGSHPEDIYVVMGPGICQNCYEVSQDVADVFFDIEKRTKKSLKELSAKEMYDAEGNACIVRKGKQAGKYHVDLWLANLCILMQEGVLPEHVSISNYCTAQNSQYLFSHRATQGKRGIMGGFIRMK